MSGDRSLDHNAGTAADVMIGEEPSSEIRRSLRLASLRYDVARRRDGYAYGDAGSGCADPAEPATHAAT
jgi:hypothetical protein